MQKPVPPADNWSLANDDLPAIYRAADKASSAGQRRFNGEMLSGLTLLILAAVAGLFTLKETIGSTMADWAGVVAAVAFFVSFILQLDRLVAQPDQKWYDGRAVAESAKTLAWRYAVGGNPFRVDTVNPKEADAVLIKRLLEILDEMKKNDATVLLPEAGEQITSMMRQIRYQDLPIRRSIYKEGRIKDQLEWYKQKALWNQKRINFWNTLLIMIEVVGFVVAIMKVIGFLQTDLLGIVGTVAAAITSWLQMKQHQILVRSYTIASMELATIKGNIDDQETEADWSYFVDESEEAISREHTLWLASHTAVLKQS